MRAHTRPAPCGPEIDENHVAAERLQAVAIRVEPSHGMKLRRRLACRAEPLLARAGGGNEGGVLSTGERQTERSHQEQEHGSHARILPLAYSLRSDERTDPAGR